MDKAVIITSYPRKNAIHGRTTVGVASYAKNTLLAIKQSASKAGLTVLAEKISGETNYSHAKIQVKRLWERNSFLTFPILLKEMATNHKDTKTVVVEFELAMFGETPYLLPFPLFLLILKLLRKNVVIVLHQVITDIDGIGPHIVDVSNHSFKKLAINIGLKFFYRVLLALSSKIIVFEPSLKEKLTKFGNLQKITVIPHGVEKAVKSHSKRAARKELSLSSNDFIILVFGYLAWYKGTDWILQAISELKKQRKNTQIKLILAGGPNPNHVDKKEYARYITSLTNVAEELNATITGFVPENKIADYYMASDVVVLPYRTHMSASGPLSMAFTFKKPFLLSYSLREVLDQEDIAGSMKNLKIIPENIIFKTSEDFVKRVNLLRKNTKLQAKISKLSEEIGVMRNWESIGKKYHEEII